MRSALVARSLFAAALTGALFAGRTAGATGGLFVNATVDSADLHVGGHRMAMALTGSETIVWDQILTAGDRTAADDVAWVIPVRPGSRVELSSDAWFDALEAATQPIVVTPNCQEPEGNHPSDGNLGGGSDLVRLVSEAVAGPYQIVTVRASQGEALGAWLGANGYVLPASVQPVVDLYTAAGLDFVALRLTTVPGVTALQPIRIVTPGTDSTLPMRLMVAGGEGSMDMELFVLEGSRVHPFGFPEVAVDAGALLWSDGGSNYGALAAAALATSSGFAWLTESAGPLASAPDAGPNPTLGVAYAELCSPQQASTLACADIDAAIGQAIDARPVETADAGDADAGDAGDALTVVEDAEVDANAPALSASPIGYPSCPAPAACDDRTAAIGNADVDMLWVTRLQAHPLLSVITRDLTVGATSDSSLVPTVHTTAAATCPAPDDPADVGDCDVARLRPRPFNATGIATWLAGIGLVAVVRRGRRRDRAPARKDPRA